MNKTGNQQMLREINKSLLLNLVYKEGPLSRVELARKTKLSPTTVSVLIEEMINEGIVHETGTTGSGVGRKMTMLNINTNNGYVLGIDLSKATSRFVMLNLRGEIVTTKKMKNFIGEASIKEELIHAVSEFIDEQKIERNLIKWIGVSIPGALDEKQGTIIGSKYLQVQNIPLKSLLEDTFNIPAHLVNDIEAAGFAERFSGAAKGKKTIVYVLIDYGVGVGIVINNQIYHGATGQAGRIGDFYYYGTENFSNRLKAEYGDIFIEEDPEKVIESFIERAHNHEEPFKTELDEIIRSIAKYCANLTQLIDPEQLILSGWISANENVSNQLIEFIHKYEIPTRTTTLIATSDWKDLGSAVGAATLGLHKMFKTKTLL